jgi:predicted phosphoribosyltransferase
MAEVLETPRGLRQERSPRFHDRTRAGLELADRLTTHRGASNALVLGLSNGGLVTASAVARRLGLRQDIVLVRRLRAPGRPRRALGAIAEDGDPHLDREAAWLHGVPTAAIAHEVARQKTTLANRRRRLRNGRVLDVPAGGTAILVDDGLTDGLGAMAAIRALRARGIGRLVLAVPVAPAATVDRLTDMVDEIVVLETPLEGGAVGGFYDNFRLVPDAEVRELLANGPRSSACPTGG